MLFLQDAAMLTGGAGGAVLALILGMLAIVFVVLLGVWVYNSFAYTAIGRKAKLSSPGIAWIPGVGPTIIAFRASKMHWWPWLLLLSLLIFWIPVIGFIIYAVAILTFAVYNVIWRWKMLEAIKMPGWWSLLMLIPIVNLVLIGIAAWSKK
jgi:hypothetical protein